MPLSMCYVDGLRRMKCILSDTTMENENFAVPSIWHQRYEITGARSEKVWAVTTLLWSLIMCVSTFPSGMAIVSSAMSSFLLPLILVGSSSLLSSPKSQLSVNWRSNTTSKDHALMCLLPQLRASTISLSNWVYLELKATSAVHFCPSDRPK